MSNVIWAVGDGITCTLKIKRPNKLIVPSTSSSITTIQHFRWISKISSHNYDRLCIYIGKTISKHACKNRYIEQTHWLIYLICALMRKLLQTFDELDITVCDHLPTTFTLSWGHEARSLAMVLCSVHFAMNPLFYQYYIISLPLVFSHSCRRLARTVSCYQCFWSHTSLLFSITLLCQTVALQ